MIDKGKEVLEKQLKPIEIKAKQKPFPLVLEIQEKLNQIKINDNPLDVNGLYNDETKNAIIKLQQITDFTPNGIIDQNLIFRLDEIIENQVINEYNKGKTFAVLYNKYKKNNK